MTLQSIGDLSFALQNRSQTTQLKSRLNDLSAALSSGIQTDLTQHLGANQSQLARIDQELTRLDGMDRSATFVGQRLGNMQAALGVVEGLRERLMNETLLPTTPSSSREVALASADARSTFASMVTALNQGPTSQALFAGQDLNARALAPADDMLASIEAAVTAQGTSGAVIAAIDAWFDDPAGGFATIGYTGGTGPVIDADVSGTSRVRLEITAADPALREVLRAAALAAMADFGPAGLNAAGKAEVLAAAGISALSSSDGLVSLRGRVGQEEARLADAAAANAARRTAFSVSRNDLVRADPFDTATALQDVQKSLELHYAATARIMRLSLANYL